MAVFVLIFVEKYTNTKREMQEEESWGCDRVKEKGGVFYFLDSK